MASSAVGPLRRLGRRWMIVPLALLVVGTVLLLGRWGPFSEPPPVGVSQDEWRFCTDRTRDSGPGFVEAAGWLFLGWPSEVGLGHDGVTGAEVAAQPDVGIACRAANELFALTTDEIWWCEAHRPTEVAQAVAMLGMGNGPTDGRIWPPWNRWEEVQACRFAHTYGLVRRLPVIDDPASHPFFALSPDRQAWCSAAENRAVLDWVAQRLRIETASEVSVVAKRMAYARACRVGFIVRSITREAGT